MGKRDKVWLGAAGLVVSENGEWLVVKKTYGGLKDMWSLPAGFVNKGETADEAAAREVLEETGIVCQVKGLIGLRSGVIREMVSDNLLIFLMEPVGGKLKIQESEIAEACFIHPKFLYGKSDVSVMLHHLTEITSDTMKPEINGINPGDQFEYTAYKLFL
ncbi:NUDIX domain-containing protein [Bacillus massilinigeriensis]|uniref:NUDIX domain-containing protein n=1 Tax=Bacillus mediterraneensis TaxID=1805474 RepID=UPI0008F85C05|nr:NUDIX hydrolase [Bacillus mediterraneensis]